MVAPPLVGFILLAGYVAAEALGFRGLAQPEAHTVSEAAAMGDAARTLQLIASGQDANGTYVVREGLFDHTSHELTPIEAAILGRHPELVRLLQRSGATRWDRARATCFAQLRLPQVLADVGGAADAPPSDDVPDVATTIARCAAKGAAFVTGSISG
jgi:hypothetical protein